MAGSLIVDFLQTQANTLTVQNATGATIFTANTTGLYSSTGLLTAINQTSGALANVTITGIQETDTISATSATGTINFDVLTQNVLYYTSNASGNFTINFRGNSGQTFNNTVLVNSSVTATFLNTNGSTPYYNSAVTIDGVSVTPKWQGGVAPAAIWFPTWPRIGDTFIPATAFQMQNNWHTLLENPAFIQLMHRSMAYVLVLLIIFVWRKSRAISLHTKTKRGLVLLVLFVMMQALLGILTVINSSGHVPVALGVLHQMNGFFTFLAALYVWYHAAIKVENS